MRAVIAIDSFKGSLTTFQAGEAVASALRKVYDDAEATVSPLADGGEGTVEAIISATNGVLKAVTVSDPLGRQIQATYGIVRETHTAVIEMAAAGGLTLIDAKDRNPLYTTTYGVGEMIADAVREGCREFIVGIGGSATNDGGIGMLQTLGFGFLDAHGNQVPRGAVGLRELAEIRTEARLPELAECRFLVACDVKNPLCGEQGCSAVYGPQKGATQETVRDMDGWLGHYAELTHMLYPQSDAAFPGSGAAGGLGFAFLSYLGGELRSGIQLVMEATGLEAHIQQADIVVTGEGRLDGQSLMGKAPIGVAQLAQKYHKPVIALAGCVTEDAALCNEYGIDAFFPILRIPCSLEDAMNTQKAYGNLAQTAEQVFRLVKRLRS